jgi:hypothetical protein
MYSRGETLPHTVEATAKSWTEGRGDIPGVGEATILRWQALN